MKGQSKLPENIGWTLFVIIVIMFVVVISLIMVGTSKIRQAYRGEQGIIIYSLEFLTASAKPFYVGETLSFYSMEDRQFFEHALESTVAGSAEKASSLGVVNKMKDFIDIYDFNKYYISISNGNDIILPMDNLPIACGGNDNSTPEGVCVNFAKDPFQSSRYGKCGVGRVEIEGTSQCRFYQICCKEDGPTYSEYLNKNPDVEMVPCAQGKGVCSSDPWKGHDTSLGSLNCDEGRIRFPDDESCQNANTKDINLGLDETSQTPICCVQETPKTLTSAGITFTAEIPLFFRGIQDAMIEVNIE